VGEITLGPEFLYQPFGLLISVLGGLLAGVVAQAVDGRMPADQETIRYTGFFGADLVGKSFLSREVLGGGSGGATPRNVCRNHLPRAAGDVRAALDVSVISPPLPIKPRLMSSSAGRVTRRNCEP